MSKNFLPIDIKHVGEISGNVYKSLVIVGKRANQLTVEVKEELTQKLAEFAPAYDNLEEVMENKEQIEISKFYESLPKPVAIAVEEYLNDKVYFRNPFKEEAEQEEEATA